MKITNLCHPMPISALNPRTRRNWTWAQAPIQASFSEHDVSVFHAVSISCSYREFGTLRTRHDKSLWTATLWKRCSGPLDSMTRGQNLFKASSQCSHVSAIHSKSMHFRRQWDDQWTCGLWESRSFPHVLASSHMVPPFPLRPLRFYGKALRFCSSVNPQLKPTATRSLRTIGFVWGDAVGLRRGRLLSKLQTGTRRCLAQDQNHNIADKACKVKGRMDRSGWASW